MTEKIMMAAIQCRGKIFVGARHSNIRADVWGEYKSFPRPCIDGFLTTAGRFVDREEAAEIAFRSGQTPGKYDELYSEDIY